MSTIEQTFSEQFYSRFMLNIECSKRIVLSKVGRPQRVVINGREGMGKVRPPRFVSWEVGVP